MKFPLRGDGGRGRALAVLDEAMYSSGAKPEGDDSMPSTYRREGSPFWWCSYRDWKGNRVQRSTGLRKEADARAAALMLEQRHAWARLGLISPADIVIAERSNSPIAAILDLFLDEVKSTAQRNEKRGAIDKFIDYAQVVTAADFAGLGVPQKLRDWVDEFADKGDTIDWCNKRLWHVQDFAKWLYEQNYVRTNEAGKVRAVRGTSERRIKHRAFTVPESESIGSGEFGGYYLFRCWTGVRGSEVSQMVRDDFVLTDKPTFTVRKEIAKNGLEATLPLPSNLAARLSAEIGMAHPTAMAFADVPQDRNDRRKLMAEHVKAAGLNPVELNGRSFRMTHTTWLRAAGLDSDTIGTLRRDRGKGSVLLQRWKYTDMDQLMPYLRAELAKVESWVAGQTRKVKKA